MSDFTRAAGALFIACLLPVHAALGQGQVQGQEPLTLKQAIALAVANSTELALANARHSVALGQSAQARAPFRPSLFTGSGAAYTNGFPMTPGGAAPAVFNLSYVQTLFNPPLRGQAREAERMADAERLSTEQSRDAVVLRTALVFLDLVQVRHAIEVERGARDAAKRILGVTNDRIGEGRELAIEGVRAELSGARVEQHIVQLEGREDTLSTELGNLIGRPGQQSIAVVPETIARQPERPPADLVSLAIANNSELQQADHERQARADRLQGERGGYWPTVDLVAEYALLSKINNYDEFFQKFQRHNINAGIQARWSIFSSATSSAVRLARSELQLADAAWQHKREEIELTVRRQSQRAREMKSTRDVASLELKLAQENLRVFQERFQAERANLRDVENARLEESEKWIAFLQADYESQQALLELLKTTGELKTLFQ